MKKVIMFGANWCGPCRMSKPVFNSLKETKTSYQYEFVDIDENPVMATNFNVTAVPTFVITENDVEVSRVLGDITKLKQIL